MVKYGSLQGLKGHIADQKEQLGVGWKAAVTVGGCSQTYMATSLRAGGVGGESHYNPPTAIFSFLVKSVRLSRSGRLHGADTILPPPLSQTTFFHKSLFYLFINFLW